MIVQPQIPYSYDPFPEEVLVQCFSFLNLEDMPIVELVCTIWNRVSSDDFCWKTIAFERKINRDVEMLSLRAKVLTSFGPYCKAARIIFPQFLSTTQANLTLAQERILIDNAIGSFTITEDSSDITRKDMIQLFHPVINRFKINIFKKLFKASIPEDNALLKNDIERMIPIAQVLMTSKIFKADDLLTGTAIVFSDTLDIPRIAFIRNRILYEPQELIKLDKLDQTMEMNSILPKYLSHYTERPSTHSIFSLCSTYSFSTWLKDLGKINAFRNEKSDILQSLLKDLTGETWALAFEKFMKNENIEVALNIEYPDYLHILIKKMDETDFKSLFDTSKFLWPLNDWLHNTYTDLSTFLHPIGDPFHDYMIKRMMESYEQSLLAIRRHKI